LPLTLSGKFYGQSQAGGQIFLRIAIGASASSITDGQGIQLTFDAGSSIGTIVVFQDTTTKATSAIGAGLSNAWYNFKFRFENGTIKYKVWTVASGTEPTAWDSETSFTFSDDGNYLQISATAGNPSSASFIKIEDFKVEKENLGYTLKYKIEGLTDVDKLETITTLLRQDTTNQDPVLYETVALLY